VRRRHLSASFFVLLSLASARLGAQVSQAEYRQRRDALAAKMDDGILLALGAAEPSEDFLSFSQAPHFEYLTGFDEPDAALVIVKTGTKKTSTMFVQPRSPANEVWTGTRTGVEGVERLTGMKGRDAGQLHAALDSLSELGLPLYVVANLGGGQGGALTPDAQLLAAIKARHPALEVRDAKGLVARQRGTKSAAELALIRKAAEITVAAQNEAIRAIEPGMNEFEIQALIEYTFRRRGADRPSFSTIVGSGPNSTTLHYNRDDRLIKDGDLIVMDIGASAKGYAADVTRTVPANGKFSPTQREVYQIVRDAQAAAERQAKLGGNAWRMTDSSTAVLADGLTKLGLIESPKATYQCDNEGTLQSCPQYTLYYMHSIGHGIGLEVHDPERYYFEPNVIGPGSAFTLEPGIYVRANTVEIIPDTPANRAFKAKIAPAVAKYANVGVRIEDDYVATDKGVEWVSKAPREIDEIEALMRAPSDGPQKRDASLIQWYTGSGAPD
jgi:Xaa-Pro aminopeptidase